MLFFPQGPSPLSIKWHRRSDLLNEALKAKIISDLKRSRRHLEYSFQKVKTLSFAQEFDDEQLETLESFASRFARFSDLVIKQYLTFRARESDPGFRGSVIDLLNLSERFGWIASAIDWRRIRELRNISAHDYSAEDFKELYEELITRAPILLSLKIEE